MSRWTLNVGFVVAFATMLLGAATVLVRVYPDPDEDKQTLGGMIDKFRNQKPAAIQSGAGSPTAKQPAESPRALVSGNWQGSSVAPAVPDTGQIGTASRGVLPFVTARGTEEATNERKGSGESRDGARPGDPQATRGVRVGDDVPAASGLRGFVSRVLRGDDAAGRAEVTEAAPEWGWHQAVEGDKYHPKVYAPNPYGWGPNFVPAEVGKFYFVYAGTLTHVVALPCDDERVDAAVSAGRKNVYCDAGGFVVRFNADDAALTPLVVFSEHDRMMEGR